MRDDSTPTAEQAVAVIRDVVPPPEGDATGLRAWVTGEAGFEADRSAAVEGIDETLLLVTVAVLLVLLLAIYRSPLVALVPLAVVVLAYLVAAGVTYGLVAAGLTSVSGQTTAILIVLMFGAGTDYCLLIVARFRDELGREEDVGDRDGAGGGADGAGDPLGGRDRRRGDARARARRLQRDARDGADPRPGRRDHGARRADAAAGGATVLGRRAFWPAVPRAGDRGARGRRDLGRGRRPRAPPARRRRRRR